MRGGVNRGCADELPVELRGYLPACPRIFSTPPSALSGDAPRAAMGVPAFFKWLSTKYGKIIVDCLEERHTWSDARVRVRVRG